MKYFPVMVSAILILLRNEQASAFSLNDRVSANASPINIRPSPAGTPVSGTQTAGSLGTVIGGPLPAVLNGAPYNWYNIDFDTGSDGWVADVGLNLVAHLQQPTGVSASASPGYIQVSWIDNSTGESSYLIERKAGSGAFSLYSTLGANITTFRDSSISPGILYTYRVFASSGTFASPYSAEAAATAMAVISLQQPTSISAVASPGKIQLSWMDNSSGESDYRVERKLGGGTFSLYATLAANSVGFNDISVTAGNTYTYRVFATSGASASVYSSEVSATAAADLQPATGLGAVASNLGIQISWIDNSTGEANYLIERKVGSGSFSTYASIAANSSSYLDSGVNPGILYTYRIYSTSGAFASSYSGEISATGLMTATLQQPTGVSAISGPSGIKVNWIDNSTGETEYKIERKVSSGSFSSYATLPADSTSYVDSTVTSGITYTYRIFAAAGTTASIYSSEVSATALAITGGGLSMSPLGLTFSSIPRPVIDLLVTFTPAAATEAGGDASLINEVAAAVKQSNQAYVNSLINHRLRLLMAKRVNYAEATGVGGDILKLADKSDAIFNGVHSLRDRLGADIVALIVASSTTDPNGGIAKTMHVPSPTFESDALCVVRHPIMTGYFGLPHEIGHIFGSGHNYEQAMIDGVDGIGAYSYSYGYILPGNNFGDIMSYPHVVGGNYIPYFSNPDVLYQGVPTGVKEDQLHPANNALSMNRTASTVEAFRSAVFGGNVLTFSNNSPNQITITSISPETPAPWISVTPASPIIINPSETQNITVQIDYNLAPSGYSNVRLLIVTNNATSAPFAGGGAIIVDNVSNTPSPIATAPSNVSSAGFTANWLAVNGATGYRLDVSTSPNFAFFVPALQDLDVGNVLSKTIPALNAGTTYYYRVRAYNNAAISLSSGPVSVTTLSLDILSAISDSASGVTSNGFIARWFATTGATGYRLDISTSPKFAFFLPTFQNLDVGNVFTKVVTGLNAGTTYYYRIRAYNSSSISADSAAVMVDTLPLITITAPTVDFPSSITSSGFTANWLPINAATGYSIDLSTSINFDSFVPTFQNLDVGNVLSKVFTGLNSGTTYYHRIRAYNSSATSTDSGTATAKTLDLIALQQITSTGLKNGNFIFALNGPVGNTYVVQSSSDLFVWSPFSTNTIPGAGYTNVFDFQYALRPKRFYRVISVVDSNVMAIVPAGEFQLGDAFGEGDPNELPVHAVTISQFYLEKNEVTKALWDVVYQWGISHGYTFDNPGLGKAPTHPVHTISWFDSVKWCNARSEMEGKIPSYYTDTAKTAVYRTGQVNIQNGWVKWSVGYRLPTEAEWEKAARGGLAGKRFPWGDAITSTVANYNMDPRFNDGVFPYTSPAGSFAPNAFGLYDMAGNVNQWCWDWEENYSSAPQTDPHGPVAGTYRIIRAGVWSNPSYNCRVAYRGFNSPLIRNHGVGLRCVLSPGTN